MCAPPADTIDTLTNTRISRRECALAAADSARPIACAATPKAGFTLRAETSRTFRVTDPRVACAALGVAGAVTGGPRADRRARCWESYGGRTCKATRQGRGIAGTCLARWNSLPRAPGNADPKALGRSRHAARVLRRTESTCRSSAAKPGPTCRQGWGWEWEGRIRTVTRLEESMRHPEDTFRRAEQSICVSEDSIRSILAAILLVTAEKP